MKMESLSSFVSCLAVRWRRVEKATEMKFPNYPSAMITVRLSVRYLTFEHIGKDVGCFLNLGVFGWWIFQEC